jgi:hypothetical protein
MICLYKYHIVAQHSIAGIFARIESCATILIDWSLRIENQLLIRIRRIQHSVNYMDDAI